MTRGHPVSSIHVVRTDNPAAVLASARGKVEQVFKYRKCPFASAGYYVDVLVQKSIV